MANDRALSETWQAPLNEHDDAERQAEIDAAWAERAAQLADQDGWAR